jgi:hypothetical protein
MGAAAAVILMKERQLIEAFERAGSLSAAQAVVPEDIGVDQSGVGWRRLRSRAVVRESGEGSGRYYLDLEVWRAVRRTRFRVMAIVLIVGIAVGLAISLGVLNQ